MTFKKRSQTILMKNGTYLHTKKFQMRNFIFVFIIDFTSLIGKFIINQYKLLYTIISCHNYSNCIIANQSKSRLFIN